MLGPKANGFDEGAEQVAPAVAQRQPRDGPPAQRVGVRRAVALGGGQAGGGRGGVRAWQERRAACRDSRGSPEEMSSHEVQRTRHTCPAYGPTPNQLYLEVVEAEQALAAGRHSCSLCVQGLIPRFPHQLAQPGYRRAGTRLRRSSEGERGVKRGQA